jgi:hypothetical protein
MFDSIREKPGLAWLLAVFGFVNKRKVFCSKIYRMAHCGIFKLVFQVFTRAPEIEKYPRCVFKLQVRAFLKYRPIVQIFHEFDKKSMVSNRFLTHIIQNFGPW